ncbi:MAG: hypothetical protein R3360_00935 [Alphaproteobacteria bacterium]|nr:hypothetical protein [Alphaproteobacteria bacterium]
MPQRFFIILCLGGLLAGCSEPVPDATTSKAAWCTEIQDFELMQRALEGGPNTAFGRDPEGQCIMVPAGTPIELMAEQRDEFDQRLIQARLAHPKTGEPVVLWARSDLAGLD